MVKKKKQKKEIGKDHGSLWILFAIIIVLVVIIFTLFLKSQNIICGYGREWLVANCECIEWDGETTCPEGYALDGELCRSGAGTGNKVTNANVACSKYKCPEFFVDDNGTKIE